MLYHVFIKFQEDNIERKVAWFNLSKALVVEKIAKPFNLGRKFLCYSKIIDPTCVKNIWIFGSDILFETIVLPNHKNATDTIKTQEGLQYLIECFGLRKVPGITCETDEFINPSNDKSEIGINTNQKENDKRIFVVHGFDTEMKEAVARTLEKLDCEAIILHEQPNEGRTIIEKFTDYSNVSFAVVLLSPDDMAYKKGESAKTAIPRARQNVILELGFFMGKLERNHIIALRRKSDNFEIPSDYSGVVYIDYDENGHWRYTLAKELRACGFKADSNKL